MDDALRMTNVVVITKDFNKAGYHYGLNVYKFLK